jgi:hypothetical protein
MNLPLVVFGIREGDSLFKSEFKTPLWLGGNCQGNSDDVTVALGGERSSPSVPWKV